MSDNMAIQNDEFVERFRDAFDEMVVYKDLKKAISSPLLNCPLLCGIGS